MSAVSLKNRVIVLDFDGVVWDSVDEAFEQAWNAWTLLHGKPTLAYAGARERFREGRWQCRDGHDFYVLFQALVTDVTSEPGHWSADAFRAERVRFEGGAEAARFVEAFYASRSRMRDDDTERWLALQRPFPGVVEQVSELTSEARAVAVATTKDAPSATLLLEHAGVRGICVYGREVSLDKRVHLRAIGEHFGVAMADMVFVEDLLENLRGVSELGVHRVLADWGYNTASERAAALLEGVAVVSLADFADRLRAIW